MVLFQNLSEHSIFSEQHEMLRVSMTTFLHNTTRDTLCIRLSFFWFQKWVNTTFFQKNTRYFVHQTFICFKIEWTWQSIFQGENKTIRGLMEKHEILHASDCSFLCSVSKLSEHSSIFPEQHEIYTSCIRLSFFTVSKVSEHSIVPEQHEILCAFIEKWKHEILHALHCLFCFCSVSTLSERTQQHFSRTTRDTLCIYGKHEIFHASDCVSFVRFSRLTWLPTCLTSL